MRLICSIILLIFVFCSFAQTQDNIKFYHYTTKDGLSFNSVRCLFQDKKGYIWIGTDGGGLNRFDGYHFTVYSNLDNGPQSISNDQIFSIIEDHSGYLWIATGNGLNRLDPNTGEFKRYYHDPKNPKSLKHNKVTYVFEDSGNNIWVGTVMGLHKFEPATETFKNYYEKMTVKVAGPTREISTIVEDLNGNLWLGTWWGGLKKFNKKTEQFTDFYNDPKNPNSIRNNNVMSLYLDNDILWIGNYLGGLRKFNITSEKYEVINDLEKDANVMGICGDKSGAIWFSRNGIGILNTHYQYFNLLNFDKTNPSGINSGNYFPIICDKTGIVWVGSEQGLSMYDTNREKFTPYYKAIDNENDKIEKIYLDSEESTLWLGTLKNGIIKYDKNKQQVTRVFSNQNTINQFQKINALFGNINNQLWIGTNNGIGIMDTRTNKITDALYNNKIKPTPANRVYGNNEFMWLANDKVRIFDVLRQKEYEFPFTGPLTLPWQILTSILNVNDSILWIGTYEGLSKYNTITSKLTNYYNHLSDSTSISNKYILSIYKDSRNNIWIGTQNGLNKYNPQNDDFVRFTNKVTFASNYIVDIREDKHQNLWLFTNKGITKFNPTNGLVRNYDEKDGLDFGGHVFSDKDGLFYCNHRNENFYIFNPDSIKDNPIIPPVYITRFLLFNKEVPVSTKSHKTPLKVNISETREITLKHNQSYMSFEFVALNYTLPQKNQYAYQMEGFDKNWYYTDASRLSATYTYLKPGTYVFRVKASNNDGVWNEQGREIKIVILPPFWKTKLAYVIYFLIIVSLLYLLRNYMLNQYKLRTKIEIDQMKLNFFGNISHEFRTPLTLIAGPLDYLLEHQSDTDRIKEYKYLTMMKRNVDRLLHLINKVLDIKNLDSGFRNVFLKNGDIIQFIISLAESFNFKAEQKDIRFNVMMHQTNFETWFDPDVLDKIISNLLSNAFKFTPERGAITIEATVYELETEPWKKEKELSLFLTTSNFIKLTVKDNGIGIPAEQKEKVFERFFQSDNHPGLLGGSGIGLALVKELIDLVGGKINVESSLGVGSCFTVWIPIGKHLTESTGSTSFVVQEESIPKFSKTILPINQNQYESEVSKTDESADKPLILIIEDNIDMGLFVADMLQNNFQLLEASNGKSGFELALEHIPDLIISDIMMPDMDGLEMCKLIKSNERTNHIPVILLTALSTEEYQVEGLFAGADDYIMKPFNSKNLQLRVMNMIKSRQLMREKFSLVDFIANPSLAKSLDNEFINKIRGIVEKHIDDSDFDPQKFADEVGMSRTQFYRKVKAITNQTVNDFIFSVRINMSIKLLLTENMNISEAAYAVGFKTPDHFSKVFRAHMGVPPSKFVEQKKS